MNTALSFDTVLVLDTGPLELVTNPRQSGENLACYQWLETLVAQDRRIIMPEIADYEVRRELLRAGKVRGLRRLDTILSTLEYLPITTAGMRHAAQLWADIRRKGVPTAPNDALDGDVILAAQALTVGAPNLVIVTTNVGHLSRFAQAVVWRQVPLPDGTDGRDGVAEQ